LFTPGSPVAFVSCNIIIQCHVAGGVGWPGQRFLVRNIASHKHSAYIQKRKKVSIGDVCSNFQCANCEASNIERVYCCGGVCVSPFVL
jgi:hypothetical protein